MRNKHAESSNSALRIAKADSFMLKSSHGATGRQWQLESTWNQHGMLK
jgi:hypothetical protein